MDPMMTAGVGLGTAVAGSVLGGLGADKEAKRRQRAVRQHADTMRELRDALTGYHFAEGDARLADLGTMVSGRDDWAGATADRDAAAGRVAARAGVRAPTATPGASGDVERAAFAAGLRGADDDADAWLTQALMDAITRRNAQGRTGAQVATQARAPGYQGNVLLNQLAQQRADLALQETLGQYDGAAATQQLIGALLQGVGGMGMQYAGQGAGRN